MPNKHLLVTRHTVFYVCFILVGVGLGHTSQCPGFIPRSVLMVLEKPYAMPRIEAGSTACKVSILPLYYFSEPNTHSFLATFIATLNGKCGFLIS